MSDLVNRIAKLTGRTNGDPLKPENRALFERIWREEVEAGRRSFLVALDRLLDAARAAGDAKGRSADHPDYEPPCDVSGQCEPFEEERR
ncbi:MAG TPA: hypothetical protein VJP88_08765 [Caulobacteraceae bacterium]|nr:hypothetical protein [Caulobacteraceae bacterium]